MLFSFRMTFDHCVWVDVTRKNSVAQIMLSTEGARFTTFYEH